MSNFQDYLFNTSEVNNEFNLLNDFLNTSLLDEAAYQGEDIPTFFANPSQLNTIDSINASQQSLAMTSRANGSTSSAQPVTVTVNPKKGPVTTEKAKEIYYMTAADPAGTDMPEERMEKLLRAKHEAGMLKPFNYVSGYARLGQWMEKNLKSSAREQILRQFNSFRPDFRKRIQRLTDMELVKVEMWFERKLMEYDRVFASMAIPACCWRRTGEIFRGNREMTELIHVPLEHLRDVSFTVRHLVYLLT